MARVRIRSYLPALLLLGVVGAVAGAIAVAQVGGVVGVPGRQPANPVVHPGGGSYGGPGDTVPPGGSGSGSGNPCLPPPVCAASPTACTGTSPWPGIDWEEDYSSPCVNVGGDQYEAYGVNLTLGALKDLCDTWSSGGLTGFLGPGNTLKVCYSSLVDVQQVHVFESSWLSTACYLHSACGAVPVRVCINGQSFHNGTIPGSSGLGWGGFGCSAATVCLVFDLDCLCCAIDAILAADPDAPLDKWLFHVGFVSCFEC